jgi:hypothetical protein
LVEMIVSPAHIELQRSAHAALPRYGVHGYRWVPDALQMTAPGDTILDYGCGKGAFAREMARHDRAVHEYDPGISGKDSQPEPADMVICTDVLPFVERDKLAATVAHIEALARKALFVAIPYHPKHKLALYPEAPHIVMLPGEWRALFRKPVTHDMQQKPNGTPYLVVRWRA